MTSNKFQVDLIIELIHTSNMRMLLPTLIHSQTFQNINLKN